MGAVVKISNSKDSRIVHWTTSKGLPNILFWLHLVQKYLLSVKTKVKHDWKRRCLDGKDSEAPAGSLVCGMPANVRRDQSLKPSCKRFKHSQNAQTFLSESLKTSLCGELLCTHRLEEAVHSAIFWKVSTYLTWPNNQLDPIIQIHCHVHGHFRLMARREG